MLPLDRRKGQESPDNYDTSSDEDVQPRNSNRRSVKTANWNDIPEDFLTSGSRDGKRSAGSRSRSRGRRKGD